MTLRAIVLPSLCLIACASQSAPPANSAKSPQSATDAHARAFVLKDDPRVGTYVSSPWGFSTESYWIVGPSGVILIDTQFLTSAANEAVDAAERLTGKKVVLAIVLHPNPDKFNGTAALQKRGIRVVTSAEVLAHIPEVHEKRIRAFYDRYKPDYPFELPKPESFGKGTRTISAGGTTVTAHVLGAGCSEAHVAVEWEGHLFVGDLVANKTHSWLELGLTNDWLARISDLRAMHPRWVHPGRGASGGPELLDGEEQYLHDVQAAVARHSPRTVDDEAGISAVKQEIAAHYPNYDFDVFLNIGIPAEWNRQAREARVKR